MRQCGHEYNYVSSPLVPAATLYTNLETGHFSYLQFFVHVAVDWITQTRLRYSTEYVTIFVQIPTEHSHTAHLSLAREQTN